MGLIRSIVKGAVVGAARELIARFGTEPSPSPTPQPAQAPPAPAPPVEVILPRQDPRTELADFMDEQAFLRRSMPDSPLIDPDYDEILRGTTKGYAVLASHGYQGSNPWQAQ